MHKVPARDIMDAAFRQNQYTRLLITENTQHRVNIQLR